MQTKHTRHINCISVKCGKSNFQSCKVQKPRGNNYDRRQIRQTDIIHHQPTHRQTDRTSKILTDLKVKSSHGEMNKLAECLMCQCIFSTAAVGCRMKEKIASRSERYA